VLEAQVVTGTEHPFFHRARDRGALGRIPVNTASVYGAAFAAAVRVVVGLVTTDRTKPELRGDIDEQGCSTGFPGDIAAERVIVFSAAAAEVEAPAKDAGRRRAARLCGPLIQSLTI